VDGSCIGRITRRADAESSGFDELTAKVVSAKLTTAERVNKFETVGTGYL